MEGNIKTKESDFWESWVGVLMGSNFDSTNCRDGLSCSSGYNKFTSNNKQEAVKASNSPRDWKDGVRMAKKINESGRSVSHMFTRSHASKRTILWHISKSEWELLDCHVNYRFMALYIYARFDCKIPCFAVTGIFIKQIWFVKKTLALIA